MDRHVFMDGLNEIFSFFGRKTPDDRICESIFRRVKELPPEFMVFAIRHFEDQESLPRNLGFYLLRILWPEYLAKNPNLQAHEKKCCPLCIPELPGWRRMWKKDITGWGEEYYMPIEVRCTCGVAQNPRNEPIYSDFELERMGLLFQNPKNYTKENTPEWLQKVIFCDQEKRKEHMEYTENFVEEEF